MSSLARRQPVRRSFGLAVASLFASFLGGSLILVADTPRELMTAEVGTCYCHCAGSHARRGCVKMCELPKYASRPWATTCAKPRLKLPVEERDAGPRFEHPGRSERAEVPKAVAGSSAPGG